MDDLRSQQLELSGTAIPAVTDSTRQFFLEAITARKATNTVNMITSVSNTFRHSTQPNSIDLERQPVIALNTSSGFQHSPAENLKNVTFEPNAHEEGAGLIQLTESTQSATVELSQEGFRLESSITESSHFLGDGNTSIQTTAERFVGSPSTTTELTLTDLKPEIVSKPILSAIQNQLAAMRAGSMDGLDNGVRIQLDPHELGTVTVEVQNIDNITKIQIVTDQPMAHSMLEKNIEALLQSLDQSDGRTFDVDVSQQDSNEASRENEKQQTSTRRASHSSPVPEDKTNQSLAESPIEGGINMVV